MKRLWQALPIIVNTSLNGLDAITYGPLFYSPAMLATYPELRQAGIYSYLLSTSVAQLIISTLSSFPHGVTACATIESIPFMQMMGDRMMRNVSDEVELKSTLLMAHGLQSWLTFVGFAALLMLDLEKSVHQIPRTVLLGTMGGVGVFLLRAGVGMAHGRLVVLALVIAALTVACERTAHPPFLAAVVAMSIMAVFYSAVYAFHIDWDSLMEGGWVPAATGTGGSAASQFDLRRVNYAELAKALPLSLGAAFFCLMQIPVNVPTFARHTGFPFRMNRVLLAHAVSNLFSTFVGFVPTSMAYTNSILFLKSGASSKETSVLLSLTTFALVFMTKFISFLPNLLILYLTFNLSIDLIVEAIVCPFHMARTSEFLIILAMMLASGLAGLSWGLITGLLLAFAHHSYDFKAPIPPEHGSAVPAIGHGKSVIILKGYLSFANSVHTINCLSRQSPGQLFMIVDMSRVSMVDLNIVEGFHSIVANCKPPLEVMLVGCRSDKLACLNVRKFDTLAEAIAGCEDTPSDRMESSDTKPLLLAERVANV